MQRILFARYEELLRNLRRILEILGRLLAARRNCSLEMLIQCKGLFELLDVLPEIIVNRLRILTEHLSGLVILSCTAAEQPGDGGRERHAARVQVLR